MKLLSRTILPFLLLAAVSSLAHGGMLLTGITYPTANTADFTLAIIDSTFMSKLTCGPCLLFLEYTDSSGSTNQVVLRLSDGVHTGGGPSYTVSPSGGSVSASTATITGLSLPGAGPAPSLHIGSGVTFCPEPGTAACAITGGGLLMLGAIIRRRGRR